MMKKKLLTFSLVLAGWTIVSAQILTGKVTEGDKKEPLYAVNVALYKNGVLKTGVQTDFDGLYRITELDPGTYDVQFSLIGYATIRQTGMVINAGQTHTLDIQLSNDAKMIDVITIVGTKIPIVATDQTSQGMILGSKQLDRLPTKDLNGIVGLSAGVTVDKNGQTSMRGSRPDGTAFYIDGVRASNTNSVPVSELEQIQVVTGGIEAKYGDVTGGIISATTKGPSEKYSFGLEAETSQYLDAYGYNLITTNASGPLLRRVAKDKDGKPMMHDGKTLKESVIGFRMSAQYRYMLEPNPSAVPMYVVKEDVLTTLKGKPVTYLGGITPVPSAELLTAKDFNLVKVRPGEDRKQYNFTGKLDFKIAKGVDFTVGGSYYGFADKFTPSNGTPGKTTRMFNSENNPTDNQNYTNVNVRFRHRLGNGSAAAKGNTGLVIENISYTLQGGYELYNRDRMDSQHGKNLFNYGHVGKFDYVWNPVFERDTAGFRQAGYNRQLRSYTPGDKNPVLANYNQSVESGSQNYLAENGLTASTLQNVWNYHKNVGAVYNTFALEQAHIYTGNAKFNFDILPNGNKKNAHNIEVGFLYEQRVDRKYSVAPSNLWGLAQQAQDRHLQGSGSAIDTTLSYGDTTIAGFTTKLYRALVKTSTDELADIKFYKSLRAVTGQKLYQHGNVMALDPSQLSLSMFSAQELTDQNLIDYYGYDYLGNQLGTKTTFEEFFKTTDKDGVRTFPVAPSTPIYMAGYIQDKFVYHDLIVRAGIRMDRFDANTKVMKDQYSLYDIMNAKDFYAKKGLTKPDNIADDYKVYTTRDGGSITGFRKGDDWYNARGESSDPLLIYGEGGQVFPKYNLDTFQTIKQRGFDPKNSFTDYTPQVNFMPRLAFSFAIGEYANFFAHYDVLVQRPTQNGGGTEWAYSVNALDYYYFGEKDRTTENNASLKPQKTIDWEVGFQQKLTNTTGLKVTAYYKDLRDMIQLRYYKFLPSTFAGGEYLSYGNVDFGTVKGFSAQYDLRRTGNISGLFNYTLQFAEGTGSDAGSQRDILKNGNIRTISPLSYDERHRFTCMVDFRYEDGNDYNGPQLFGKNILENFGVNIQALAVSGRPYTAKVQPTEFDGSQIAGGINGSRLPWNFNLDMRIDKTFNLSKNPKSPLNVNVYLRVQNVLNAANLAGVYSASGSPSDDGYLQSSFGQNALANLANSRPNDIASYRFSYLARLVDPGNYYLPRRIYLGASFGF
jgi:Carboxypeptidase regulatory-like domain/TonB-dependent Receptor Plug Domain